MELFCSRCHTCWTEGVLNIGGKCPFKDCDGWLSGSPPVAPVKPEVPKKKPTYPLLEDLP